MGNFFESLLTTVKDSALNYSDPTRNDVSPYQQMLSEQYLSENPNADWTGIPGYEQVQKKFNDKMKDQNPLQGVNGRASGKSRPETMEYRGESKKDSALSSQGVVMGAKGLREAQPRSRKEFIFNKIQEKKAAGAPLSKTEIAFEKKYLGISDSKNGPKSVDDRIKIRKMAKDMAKAEAIKDASENNPDLDLSEYEPDEEMISEYILDAAQYLYPNMEIDDAKGLTTMMGGEKEGTISPLPSAAEKGIEEYQTKQGKKVILDIELPSNITKASQALEFLMKNGLEENEAREWLRVRM